MSSERKEYLSLLSYSVTDGLHSLIWEISLFLWIFEYLPAFVTVLTNNIIQNADINSFNTRFLQIQVIPFSTSNTSKDYYLMVSSRNSLKKAAEVWKHCTRGLWKEHKSYLCEPKYLPYAELVSKPLSHIWVLREIFLRVLLFHAQWPWENPSLCFP